MSSDAPARSVRRRGGAGGSARQKGGLVQAPRGVPHNPWPPFQIVSAEQVAPALAYACPIAGTPLRRAYRRAQLAVAEHVHEWCEGRQVEDVVGRELRGGA